MDFLSPVVHYLKGFLGGGTLTESDHPGPERSVMMMKMMDFSGLVPRYS